MEENCFTVLCWGLSYISMNQSQVTRMSPPSWSSLPPPTQSHSSRLSQSTGFSSRPYTANSHWLSVLQMIIHMFQCYCLSLSHPLLPCGVEVWFLRRKNTCHVGCLKIVVVQSLSRVQLFATPWTAAWQTFLSFTISQSLLKLMSIDAIQPFHLLSSPSLALSLSQHQGLFQWVSSSYREAKVLELQLQHQSFQWIFRVDFL